MSSFTRYTSISLPLFAAIGPVSTIIARRYGTAASRRFRIGMSSTLVAQQALVGLAVVRSAGHSSSDRRGQLDLVDLMTLSRGWTASLLVGLLASGIRDRRGIAGWLGWLAILYGAILCDWLDGPIARYRGSSEVGALFDREADSWLTLCTAGAAVGWGNLPVAVAAAPILRYLLLFESMRTMPYGNLHDDEPGWVRHMGIVQMLLFIAALAPFRGRATSCLVRLVACVQTPIQLYGLLALRQRRRGA